MSVFITKNTLHKIDGVLDIDFNTSNRARESILKIISEYTDKQFLTVSEIKAMTNIISIVEILNSEIPEKIKLKNKRDSDLKNKMKRVIFYEDKLTYHYYNNCPNMSSDYENFTIPKEIPDAKINEYRHFFIKNIEVFKRDESAFYARAGAYFGVNIGGVLKTKFSNSGRVSPIQTDLMLSRDKDITEDAINKALSFYNENKKHIVKFGSASHLRCDFLEKGKMSIDEFNVIDEWYILKNNAKSAIFEKTMQLNELSSYKFSEDILKSIGFNPCNTCVSIRKDLC